MKHWLGRLLVVAIVATALNLPGVAHAAGPQPEPPTKPRETAPPDPAVVAAFDSLKQYVDAQSALNQGQRRSLIAKLDAAEKKYRASRPCDAADQLKPYLSETDAMTRSDRAVGSDLHQRGFGLRQSLLSHLPQGMACGIGTSWIIDTSVRPAQPDMGPGRPVGRVVDNRGNAFDYVANEVIVKGTEAEATALAARHNGTVLQSMDGPGGRLSLVRVDSMRADTSTLAANLQAANGGENGIQAALQFSDTAAAGLISVAAAEHMGGAAVAVNGLGGGDTIASGHTREAPTGPDGLGADRGSYNPDAFTWNSLDSLEKPFPSQGTNVTRAWQLLDRLGRFNSPGTLALTIHDGGFRSELGTDVHTSRVEDVNVPSSAGCTGGAACPWHGSMAMSVAAGIPDNGVGGAGPAGPISGDKIFVRGDRWAGNFLDTVFDEAFGDGDIVSMSYGGEAPASVALFLAPLEGAMAAASDGGITFVASAGNDSEDVDAEDCFIACWEEGFTFPCESAGVICVGALERNLRTRASYSNWGNEDVDMWAPGLQIAGFGSFDPPSDGTVASTGNGTSAATPFVAGVAALLVAANPAMEDDEDALRAALFDGASRGDRFPVTRIVDALESVRRALPTQVLITKPAQNTSFPRGVGQGFESVTYDYAGRTPAYTWTSNVDGVLSHASSFGVTQMSFGNHHITLTAVFPGGPTVSDTVDVTVTNTAPTVQIVEPAANATFPQGAVVPVRATSFDVNQSPTTLDESQITWFLDGVHVATGHASAFSLGATPPGPHTLIVRATDGEFTTEATRSITVSTDTEQSPTAIITSPADGYRIVPTEYDPNTGEYTALIEFVGRAVDPQDGELTPASFVWTATETFGDGGTGTIGFGNGTNRASYRVSTREDGTAGGSAVIRLTVTDSDGNSSFDEITVYADVLF